MIINRISSALKSQDWTTVFIEFTLVVLGVLVALEVDRYNELQKERAAEVDFLYSLERDLQRDINDVGALLNGFSAVESFGNKAFDTLGEQGCPAGECWNRLVELFHATQWLDASLNSATFAEMKRLGLPKDPLLKDKLEQYYVLGKKRKILSKDLPEYRRLVRSIVPPDMQRHIWSNCFSVSGRFERYSDCDSPTTEESARTVIEKLQQSTEVMEALTFWLSNLSVTTLTFPQQIDEAEQVLALVRADISS